MRTLAQLLLAPEPERAVEELPDERLRDALREMQQIERANDHVVDIWAACQVEAARRFCRIVDAEEDRLP